MPLTVIPARPPLTGYTSQPTARWCNICLDEAQDKLDVRALAGFGTPQFIFYEGPGAYQLCRVAQIDLANWTIHAQCCFHGKEEGRPDKYGNLSNRILISLDIESGGRLHRGQSLRPLQRQVCVQAGPICAAELDGEANDRPVEHHLVWESMAFDENSQRHAKLAGARLGEYANQLPKIIQATRAWADQNDVFFEELM